MYALYNSLFSYVYVEMTFLSYYIGIYYRNMQNYLICDILKV